MRIVSKFHDFYDSASIHGIDKECIYRRETVVHEATRIPAGHSEQPDFRNGFPEWARVPWQESFVQGPAGKDVLREVEWFVVGFCGKFFPGAALMYSIRKPEFFYDPKVLADRIQEIGLTDRNRYYAASRYDAGRAWDLNTAILGGKASEAFFNPATWEKLHTLFVRFDTPVFALTAGYPESRRRPCLIVNPVLTKFGFQSVRSATEAFQDIHQYRSGVLGAPARPMVEIADKYKAAAKGHDGEYSFRKPPGGGRWR
jgi:hypothetical protein